VADTPETALKELADAATHLTPASGDAAISAAFLLGWRIGLAQDWAAKGEHVPWPDDDPGLVDGGDRWAVLKGQIAATARRLVGPAPLPDLGEAPPAAQTVGACRRALLQRLYTGDQFHGIAFTLGVNLEALCAGTAAGDVRAEIPRVKLPLIALASRFPPHAAHAVINSLTLWEEQLARHAPDPEKLRRQGGVWRSVLAGDVAPQDLLRLSDYIGTAEQVVARLHELALRALRSQLAVPALVAFVLLAGGLAAMFLSDKVAAGATSVVVALGLSWKGIGQFFGRAAAQGEQALWDGQLDWTIAYRATVSLRDPRKIAMREVVFVRARRRVRGQRSRRGQEHYDTWQKWLRTWPDSALSEPAPAALAGAESSEGELRGADASGAVVVQAAAGELDGHDGHQAETP
jgi:hypothetical protein